MRIVGIDTAGIAATAALVEDGKIVAEEIHRGRTVSSPVAGVTGCANHAEVVVPLIQALLHRSGFSLNELSGFAVSIGPGSFTGLRIGLSTVKGLAYGWAIPVVGISTLLAQAARVTDWHGLICPFLDARRKEVYAALFRSGDGPTERLTEDLVAPPKKIIEMVGEGMADEPCIFIGDGINAYGDLIVSSLGDRVSVTLGDLYPSVAAAAARLSEDRFRRGEIDSLSALTPVYLRSSEAEIKLKQADLSG